MIRKLFHGLLAATILWPIAASAQVLTNPNGVTLTPATFQTAGLQGSGTTCSVQSACLQVHLPINANGAAITLAGTFVATAQFEESGDNQITWPTNVGSSSAVGLTTVSFTGITDIRVRLSAYTSGIVTATINVTLNTGLAGPPGPSGATSSPSSLSTFFNKYYGRSPNDYGAFGDAKFCYDFNVSGQPTATITSNSTFTMTNSALTGNIATYTFANTISSVGPVIAPGQILSVTGSNNANGSLNISNVPVLTASTTQVTVNFIHANVASAADTGTITTSGAGNVGCANFVSAADVGKTIEIKGIGAAGALLTTTISAVMSANQATLGANATTNATLQKGWYGHDDTAALQLWQNDINTGYPSGPLSNTSGNGVLVHSGYLKGLYFTTKPLRFVNALGSPGFCGNCGFGTPEPFSPANAGETLSIVGQGSYSSGIVALSTFNWGFPNTSVNNAVFYYQNWNGPLIENFAVLSPDNTVAFNVTANTGIVAGMISDGNGHDYVNSIEVENFHSTAVSGTGLIGHAIINNCFEASFSNMQMYNNDENGDYGLGINGANGTGNTFESCIFSNDQWLIWKGNADNVSFNAGGTFNTRLVNSRIWDTAAHSGGCELAFANSFTGGPINGLATDDFVVENTLLSSNLAGACIVGVGASSSGRLTFTNDHFASTNANASTALFNSASPNWTFNFFGGQFDCSAACSGGFINTGASLVYIYGTVNRGGNVTFGGTGAANIFQQGPQSTGWNGGGTWTVTALGNTGAATVTGTGACATVTGSPSKGTFTCTGATAASTITLTFTAPSPAATGWICDVYDQTTSANRPLQTSNTATTCVLTVASVTANDVMVWKASYF